MELKLPARFQKKFQSDIGRLKYLLVFSGHIPKSSFKRKT